ncbi:hypothetical protein JW926_18475 [Candidatus Sumerlaeota bacterium]|nr:hypothetical protein [Candidatus Sumerlaeota bacterium]
MVINVANDFQEAEDWDLEFWLRQTPEDRLSAFAALRKDVEKVKGRNKRKNLPEED